MITLIIKIAIHNLTIRILLSELSGFKLSLLLRVFIAQLITSEKAKSWGVTLIPLLITFNNFKTLRGCCVLSSGLKCLPSPDGNFSVRQCRGQMDYDRMYPRIRDGFY